jgi:hypothetical protein
MYSALCCFLVCIVVVLHQLLELMGLLQSLQSAESSADPIARLRNFKDLALQISSQVADNPNQVLSGPIVLQTSVAMVKTETSQLNHQKSASASPSADPSFSIGPVAVPVTWLAIMRMRIGKVTQGLLQPRRKDFSVIHSKTWPSQLRIPSPSKHSLDKLLRDLAPQAQWDPVGPSGA